jgi:membrane fusion protein
VSTVPDKLFRQEVIEFQQTRREFGGVTLLQPVSSQLLTWTLTTSVAVIVAFLCVAQYARKERVEGYLTPSTGRARIIVPQQGTIRAVHVKEGQHVRQGQPLLTVETAQISADDQDVNTTLLTTLAQQRDVLARNITAEERRTVSETERLQSMIRSIETEISHLNEQARLQSERISLSRSFLEAAAKLSTKGYISEIEYKRRQQELLEQQRELGVVNEHIANRQSQIVEARYSLEQLPTVMAQKVQLLANELSTVKQRITEIQSRKAYLVRAPSAGRVATLQSIVGGPADPRRLQMEIVPADSVLQAELFIPTRAIGFVQVGQDVRLLYEAFPYQKFGTYRGRIVQVSETILTGSDIAAPITLKEPVYKATVALERPDIDAGGKRVPLQADMLLTADIILEKRAIASWAFAPVLASEHIVDTEQWTELLATWIVDPFVRFRDVVRRAMRLDDERASTPRHEASRSVKDL